MESGWETERHNPRPPKSLEEGQFYCILLIRIAFYHMSKNLLLHYLLYVTKNICFYFYYNIAREVVTVLLIFFDIHQFNYTFSHAHI